MIAISVISAVLGPGCVLVCQCSVWSEVDEELSGAEIARIAGSDRVNVDCGGDGVEESAAPVFV